MKKKVRLNHEARRTQLLDTAIELFAQNGFDGVTTKQIALKAGITEALVFKHFKNKKALYAAIIERKMVHKETAINYSLTNVAGKTDYDVLYEVALHTLVEHQDDPTFLRLLLFSALEGHPLSQMFFEERVKGLADLFKEFIQRRVDEGHFWEVDPMVATRTFFGMLVHHITTEHIYQQHELEHLSNEELAASFARIFLSGVQRSGSSV